jgi:hypothetical protein
MASIMVLLGLAAMVAFFATFKLQNLSGEAGSVNYGSNRMGGVALPASGAAAQNFYNMPHGAIDALVLHISMGLISTAAAFNLAVYTGASAQAEGNDDIDKILNGIFNSWTLFWDNSNLCGTLTPAQWRTILGNFNKRDFGGTLVNGASCPISSGAATTFHLEIPIPVSLRRHFFDGAMFTNGSERLKNGSLTYDVKALTPTVTCVAGSAVVSAVSVELKVIHAAGEAGDVGPTWRVTRTLGYPTTHKLPPADGGRLFVADVLVPASNTATNINFGEATNWTPLDFGNEYEMNKLQVGGFAVNARCTPYLYIADDARFADFEKLVNHPIHWDMIGPSSVGIYDVEAVAPTAQAHAEVATRIGGGGNVAELNPTVHSLPVGSAIPATLAHMAPRRVVPVGAGVSGARISTPQLQAQRVTNRQTSAATAKSALTRLLGR